MVFGWCSFELWTNDIYTFGFCSFVLPWYSSKKSGISEAFAEQESTQLMSFPTKKKKTYRLNYPTSTTKVWWFWPTSSICVCIAFLKTSMNLMVSIPPKMWRLRVKYNNPILATCRGVVSWAGLWFSWRNLSRSSLIIDHVQSLRLLINVESPF